MKNLYPMIDGGPLIHFEDYLVLWRKVIRKIKRAEGNASLVDFSDSQKDSVFSFDEYPVCEYCGGSESEEVLKAEDGNRIVECSSCGLWFTSPRVNESEWMDWLLADNERNREFTENRLKYGVALSRNIPLNFSFWWRITRWRRQAQLKRLVALHGNSPVDIFDVGCGCGYLLKATEDMGMRASGNDLNGYAVDRMRALFGLDVHLGVLYDLVNQGSIKEGAFDIVYMNDYIEHSYHPMADIDATYKMLRNGGIVYLQTFCIDSDMFDRLGKEWDMFMWNHCFHFSYDSLSRMVEKAGFEVVEVRVDRDKGMVEICGRKKAT